MLLFDFQREPFLDLDGGGVGGGAPAPVDGGGAGVAVPTPSPAPSPVAGGSELAPPTEEYLEFTYNKEPVKVPSTMKEALLQQGYYYQNKGKQMLQQMKTQLESVAPLMQLNERLEKDPAFFAHLQQSINSYNNQGQVPTNPVQPQTQPQVVNDPRIDQVVNFVQSQQKQALQTEVRNEYDTLKTNVMGKYGVEMPFEMVVGYAAQGNYPNLRAAYLDMVADKIPDAVIKTYTQKGQQGKGGQAPVPPAQGGGIPLGGQQAPIARDYKSIKQRVMQRLGG